MLVNICLISTVGITVLFLLGFEKIFDFFNYEAKFVIGSIVAISIIGIGLVANSYNHTLEDYKQELEIITKKEQEYDVLVNGKLTNNVPNEKRWINSDTYEIEPNYINVKYQHQSIQYDFILNDKGSPIEYKVAKEIINDKGYINKNGEQEADAVILINSYNPNDVVIGKSLSIEKEKLMKEIESTKTERIALIIGIAITALCLSFFTHVADENCWY